jgi:hypothetical protein
MDLMWLRLKACPNDGGLLPEELIVTRGLPTDACGTYTRRVIDL